MDIKKGVASEEFVGELRRVLHYLYNPGELRTSPLLDILAQGRDNRLSVLRQVLSDAIQALKPSTAVPPHSNAWRIYHTLVWRYLEQWSQNDVAANLVVGARQLRRIEQLAVKVLADYLWARHDLETRREQIAAAFSAGKERHSSEPVRPEQEQELQWLGQSLLSEPVHVPTLVRGCLETVAPLIQQLNVQLACAIPEDLPATTGHSLPLRQALLNVFSAAARTAPGGRLHVAIETTQDGACVHVQAATDSAFHYPSHEATESLSMAERLLVLMGGRLEVSCTQGEEPSLLVRILLSASGKIPILVVDDNADTLRLFERYLSGSRYAFIGTTNPEEVLGLAQERAPQAIVLDVMVPGVDGWQLLSRLREHPRTGSIPVLVCTILPLEQLALTLGAATFIRKPVSRQALLSALDRHVGPQETE